MNANSSEHQAAAGRGQSRLGLRPDRLERTPNSPIQLEGNLKIRKPVGMESQPTRKGTARCASVASCLRRLAVE